jgi:hypothetical protein
MTEPTPAAAPSQGLMARAIGVVTSPKATFQGVVADPRPFGILFLVAVLIAVAQGVPQFTQAGRQATLDAQIRAVEQSGREVTPELQTQMETMARFTPYIALVGTFIVLPIMSLIMGGLYWGIFNTVLGGTASFKQVLGIVTHSQVIAALGVIIGAPIMLMQGTFTMGGPFNLGALAPMLDPASRLAKFLASISVFSLWGIFVTAVGLAVLYRRKTTGIAIALLAIFLVITYGFSFLNVSR